MDLLEGQSPKERRKVVRPARTGEQGLTLPYGPTRGMLQALQLMRKITPSKVDGNFLRLNKIAPGNEYKVVGALRFLGIIDDDGRPTEKSRLLKTKGAAFNSALRDIIRGAYNGLFQQLNLNGKGNSPEDIYNYFITEEGLGIEMATKTTRFFIQLCHLAEIDLGLDIPSRPSNQTSKREPTNGHRRGDQAKFVTSNSFPLVLVLTPEMVSMDTNQLAEFFKKLRLALDKAAVS